MLAKAWIIAGGAFVSGVVAVACSGGHPGESGLSSSSSSSSSSSGAASSSSGFGTSSGTAGDASVNAECKKMDLIFAVDNSPSMKEEQDNLVLNFPKFINLLNAYKTKGGDSLDYRVATTTSDGKKEKGKFISTKGAGVNGNCNPGPTRPWLERTDGDVATFFGCRAQGGTNGNTIETPLNNTLLGVTDRITDGTNVAAGVSFLRDDALLAFVILTDEDEGGDEDQPVRAMSEYPAAFDKVKTERGKWAAAVIAGQTKCTSNFGNASEATRDKQFITSVGANGVFSSICAGDLTVGLQAALDTFNQACANFPSGPVN